MEQLIIVVAVLPLVSALLVQLFAGRIGRRIVQVSVAATALSFLLSLLLLWWALTGYGPHAMPLGNGTAIILFDSLGALLASIILGISVIVHLYSVRYMAEEAGYAQFFVLLDLMTAALLFMVIAGDLITLLIAWYLVGVLLYFLLGQDTRSRTAYRFAFWTLITYRIGDIPLILAAALLYNAYDTWSLTTIFTEIMANPDAHQVMGLPLTEVVAALIGLAAFARSAQFLLHTWLPYTMDGPTPVSALMHAGIVNAGGFLINRFAPVFIHSGDVLNWIFMVGLITAIFGSLLMLTQNDIKKALGYSTMGQMGFMIMECGIGAFSLAIYHLFAHGVFKGTMFLSAGSVINDARQNDGIPKDELYTFAVEKRPNKERQPWILMAAITLAVPLLILVFAHLLIAEDYFQKQGAIVLLFFGWVTGAQLIFATYRMRAQNIWRLVGLSVLSLIVVVLGYAVISHAFDLFLYPDPAFRAQLYSAATIDLLRFDVLVVIITLIIVAGWVVTYYSEQSGYRRRQQTKHLWLNFYALISREFYVSDIYTRLARTLLALSGRLNVWLRWL
ncbi:MAG: NADH-quinone oxidoreductase subunit L [Gammaproteobacteria bacterium]|nr:NADH-quinone oxidoreductase subunit L [Gammaproteobacteria bacterium]